MIFLLGAGTAILPSVFYTDSTEDLVDLKGELVSLSVYPSRNPPETKFTFQVKGEDRIFSVTGLSAGDQALLGTERKGDEMRFRVERIKYDNPSLTTLSVLSLSSRKNIYLSGDSFGMSFAMLRYFAGFVVFLCFGIASVLVYRLMNAEETEEIDPFAVRAATWVNELGMKPAWAKLALDYAAEKEERLRRRPETPKSNHAKAVLLMAQKGAINVQNERGQAPLHIAAAGGHVEAVDLLIRNGAQVDLTDKEGNTPLLVAAQGNSLGVVAKLLDSGASILHRNHQGQDVLAMSEAGKKDKVITELLGKRMAAQREFNAAVESADADALYRLSKSGARVNMRDETGLLPLMKAISRGSAPVVAKLIQIGAQVDEEIVAAAHKSGNQDVIVPVVAAWEKIKAKAEALAKLVKK